jgi:hypothetical protein
MSHQIHLFLLLSLFGISCSWLPNDDFLFPVSVGEKWGYIDATGEVVIAPQFEGALPFVEGRALCLNADEKIGFIDTDGHFVIDPVYEEAGSFSEGLAPVVKENGPIQFIDVEGNVVLETKDVETCYGFKEGLARASLNGRWGFIDREGEWVVPAVFEEARDFHEGLAAVARKNHRDGTLNWGYINKSGAPEIPYQFNFGSSSYLEPGDFQEGLALVSTDGETWGYINKSGHFEINPQFDHCDEGGFSGSMGCVSLDDQMGYINQDGKYEVNLQFKQALPFAANGMAAVQSKDEKWGFIGEDGRIVINPQFESVMSGFIGGVAFVKSSGKFGLIDEAGKFVVNPQYEDVVAFTEDYNWSVDSDYITPEILVQRIFHHSGGNKFQGVGPDWTLAHLMALEEDLEVEDFGEYYISNDCTYDDWGPVIQPASVGFGFATPTYSRQTLYRTVDRYSWLFGWYEDTEFAGYQKEVLPDAMVTYTVTSWTIPNAKSESAQVLAGALRDAAKERYSFEDVMAEEIYCTERKGCHILRGESNMVILEYDTLPTDGESDGEESQHYRLVFINGNYDNDWDQEAMTYASNHTRP